MEYDPVKDTLQDLIERLEVLPRHQMSLPVTHYDYLGLLYLLRSLYQNITSLRDSDQGKCSSDEVE